MAGTLKNFYETLGVPRSATDEQIKTAYRKLILKFHPDKNVGDTYFEEWSKKIIEAFEVLSNAQLRAEYDQVYDEHKQAARKTFQEGPAAPAHTHEPEPAATAGEDASTFNESAPAPEYEQNTQEDLDFQYGAGGKSSAAEKTDEPVKEAVPGTQNLEAQALAYVEARQEYLRAEKDLKAMQKQEPAVAGKAVFWSVMALCLLLIAGSLAWIIKNPWKERVAAVPEGRVSEIATRTFIVETERAYFYKDPQNQVKTNEYLTRGMKVQISKKYQGFYYGVFQSVADPDYKLTGWIKETDLQQ